MDYFFQIDTLLLNPHFCLVLEVKNYSGHLYFDGDYKQLIRTKDDKKDIFDCPIQQVKRQVFHLSKIIELNKLPTIPIESLVVFTHPKAHIESSPNYYEALKMVIKSPLLSERISDLYRKYSKQVYSPKEIKKMVRTLKKYNEPYDPNLIKKYEIDPKHLFNGVLCPICETNTMEYIRTNWKCPICNTTSKKEHIAALTDYALLISTTISNKECKEYLKLTSSSKAYHLLSSLNFPYTGSTKSRIYHLDSLISDK
ncbi:ribosomal protein L37AE/L43A [Fictibacillus barbaricus]|uniref:Ribosomal protein L37AE/L43A n=2 Tax=Fictibacillus barbaricus TaxID=182136 RepID=A0ABU1U139_9BACL|nr:ribosomal protein L37AE/L43A [Fictibacillus barbaricus]